ncbi:MAG: glycosyltransferase [Thermoprotei archaeon]
MKVLLLGSHMNYNLEHYVYMNLVRLGHDVRFYGYKEKLRRLANPVRMTITRSKMARDIANMLWLNKVNEDIKEVAEKFRPDLVLSIKGEVVKPSTVEWIKRELNAKTALWYPDDPRFFNSLVRYIASTYDYVFTASERIIPAYKEFGCRNVHFLPFACEPTVHKKVKLNEEERRKYEADIVFVGTYTRRRAKLINALENAGIMVKVYGPYWKYFKCGDNVDDGIYGPEMVKAFNAAKIVLNVHVKDDVPYKVNMRAFEATGSGSFLLTDKTDGIEKMFDLNEEVAAYEGGKDLVELAKYYIDSNDEREEIAYKAQEKAYRKHTYGNRVNRILEVI